MKFKKILLKEAKEFFDYHTAPVDLLKGDVIDINKTGMSFYDDLLPNSNQKDYMRDEKNLVGTIEYMTPQEYYEMCSQYGFPNKIVPVEKLKQERRIDKNTLEHLKLVLTEYGRKFPIPYISIAERGQEGLHRMMVIGDMFGWDNAKYPVLVIRYADEERARIEKENKIINRYSSYIRQAVRSTLQYKFTDFDELKEQLQFDLDREFRYVDEVNKPVNFTVEEDPEDDNYYLVKVGKAQADLEKALIKWVEPQTDIDDELDLDDLELDDTEDFLRRYFGDDWRETNPELKKTFGIKEALSKNLSNIVSNISSPEELMDWMDKNITYELANDNYGAENDPPTKTAQEVLETGTGHCAEQSYLEKEVLDNLGYETLLVMVKENSSKKDYGADGSAHVFLVYKEGKNYCWFEHSMQHAKGIHKYTSLEALLQDVANQWWRYDKNSDILEVRMMDEAITGVDNWGLAKECYKLPVEYTFNISNNIMESDVPLEESVNSNSQIEYLPVSDIELFKEYANNILGGFGSMSDAAIKSGIKEIHFEGKLAGYIGFSEYEEDGHKCLGIGNFMIIERGKGLGSAVIQDLIKKYKNQYDLIYCFVDAKNDGAIRFYKKLGKVYDEEGPNDNGEYYVTFWDNNKWELDEEFDHVNLHDIKRSWSRETAHPTAQKYWTKEKPSLGQCAITALYLNEKYGYSIWETLINNRNRHFFNKDSDGNIIDLTKDQFSSDVEIDYENSRRRDPKQLLRSCNTRYQLFKKNLNNI